MGVSENSVTSSVISKNGISPPLRHRFSRIQTTTSIDKWNNSISKTPPNFSHHWCSTNPRFPCFRVNRPMNQKSGLQTSKLPYLLFQVKAPKKQNATVQHTVDGSEIRLTTWDGAKTRCQYWDIYHII